MIIDIRGITGVAIIDENFSSHRNTAWVKLAQPNEPIFVTCAYLILALLGDAGRSG